MPRNFTYLGDPLRRPLLYMPRGVVPPVLIVRPPVFYRVYALNTSVSPYPPFAVSSSWEILSGLMSGTKAACDFMWARLSDPRALRLGWRLSPAGAEKIVGGDRQAWQWFDALGCKTLPPWSGVDYEALWGTTQ